VQFFANLRRWGVVLSLAAFGASTLPATAQETVTERFPWSVDRGLRLYFFFCDNDCRLLVDGAVRWSNPGLAEQFTEVFRLDNLLQAGRTTIVEFEGNNWPRPPQHPSPWRFGVILQDAPGPQWETRRDYTRQSPGYPGDAPPGPAYRLRLEIEGR
jgi:hypothetical protein